MSHMMQGVDIGAESRRANVYDLSIYEGFPKVGEPNQQLHKVALSHGLHTSRATWTDFTAWDASERRMTIGLSFAEASSPVSGVLTSNKQLTRQFLSAARVVVPQGRTFGMNETEPAVGYAQALGFPVVVKPLAGKSGVGVAVGITRPEGVRRAIQQIATLQDNKGRFIVEEHLSGQDYRFYVAYGQVLSVVLRQPASVTGDGKHRVEDLVERKNTLRQNNPHMRNRLIPKDETSTYHLQSQGLSWRSVPQAGQQVALAAVANISRGGDSTEVLPETHPSILEQAVRAVETIPGLNQAGVDFLLTDHRAPLAEQAGGICELNTTPALMANQAPVYGPVQPVAQKLVQAAAEQAGITLAQPAESISIEVRAHGVRDPQSLIRWVESHATRLSLGGLVRTVKQRYVRLFLSGPVDSVSALVTAMHTGNLRDRPDYVRTAPTTRDMPTTFNEADT